MSITRYTTVDRVFSKFHRDLKGADLNESDAIEWIGDALGFLQVASVREEAVAFMEVKNYEAVLPSNFQAILQVAKNNLWTPTNTETVCASTIVDEVVETTETCPVVTDCDGKIVTEHDIVYYRPYFDLQWEYSPWINCKYYRQNYSPIRLANNTFFNSLVCAERDEVPYESCSDEYTIVGTVDKKLRFNFEQGSIAVSYYRNAIDPETGYPLIPDVVEYITALTYYIQWKIAEWHWWNGREGAERLAMDRERKWLKYAGQATAYAKMPKSLDQWQNIMEQTHKMIPNKNLYNGFFGSLGKSSGSKWNDPDSRNRF